MALKEKHGGLEGNEATSRKKAPQPPQWICASNAACPRRPLSGGGLYLSERHGVEKLSGRFVPLRGRSEQRKGALRHTECVLFFSRSGKQKGRRDGAGLQAVATNTKDDSHRHAGARSQRAVPQRKRQDGGSGCAQTGPGSSASPSSNHSASSPMRMGLTSSIIAMAAGAFCGTCSSRGSASR